VQSVRDYEDYTGHITAYETAAIRSRVTGELTKRFFKDGEEVKKGDKLFLIDPRTFEAALESATAMVKQATGDLKLKKILVDRARLLFPRGTLSQEELDNAQAAWEVATAALELAKANEKTAALNLEFCLIKSPIDGKIDRRMVDIGNQIIANNTMLTTIKTEDPMYAYFDVDERTELRERLNRQKGGNLSAAPPNTEVEVGLANDTDYSLRGVIDFSSNGFDKGTGTQSVRAILANPQKHPRTLSDGMFVRVRYWIGDSTPSLLVPETALVSDQGLRHLYVLNDVMNEDTHQMEQVVEYRTVEIGLQQGKMRVVKSGLMANDRVIVGGLQRVRAGIAVAAKEIEEKKPAVAAAVDDGKDKTASSGGNNVKAKTALTAAH
jgi:RND family efflux transporter MFP subunit